MTSEPRQKVPAKLNWVWIALCSVVGCGAIGVAWALVRKDEESLPGFWSGVLINVGTSILLAGVVFWLERRFVRQTGEVALSVATTAATAAAVQTAAARDRTDKQLFARLSDLEERLDKQRSAQTVAADQTLRKLNEDASYASVALALKNALQMGAITGEGLVVPAGDEVTSPRVKFIYRQAWRNEDGDGDEEGLEVAYVPIRSSGETVNAFNVFGVTSYWNEGQDPASVFHALMEQMVSRGYGYETRRLKIEPAFRHLAKALPEAVSARRGDESAWQSSASLLEVIQEGWVITTDGVEVKGRGLIVATGVFQNEPSFQAQAALGWEKPEKPDWADSEEWDVAMSRGRAVLSLRSTWP